ncbi:MAG: hypothetical protein KA339_05765 [Candidatus Kapabacteria bacterium]|nr:hypothetical protein [Ignavibacteria bacterium]MBP6510044.1 hypothetical protein [Candidatus Kapabacteria bacterium]
MTASWATVCLDPPFGRTSSARHDERYSLFAIRYSLFPIFPLSSVGGSRVIRNLTRGVVVFAICSTLFAGCSGESAKDGPQEVADSLVPIKGQVDSSAVAIAVISLDPQGWNDIRAYMNDLPSPAAVKIFYGDGNVLESNNATAVRLLDSLSNTRSLRKSDAPATLPYFSTALSSAIGSSLQSSCEHTRTVVLGTFPPLLLKTREEFERVGPIITRTEMESLSKLPDHRFIIIGPSGTSVLRDMLLRAFTEAESQVTSISYQPGETR